MNELDLIHNQLRAERARATEVARACADAAASDEFRQSCVEYLVFVLTRFEERDQMLAELYRSRFPAADPARRQMDEIVSRAGTSREALAKLEAALTASGASAAAASANGTAPTTADARVSSTVPTTADARARWRQFDEFFAGPWRARRDAIDALLQPNVRISDWRAVSFVDADSIVEERTRYARVQAAGSRRD